MDNSMDNEAKIKRIAQLTNLSVEEIEDEVAATIEKMKGLVERQGAIQLVATNYGVDLDSNTTSSTQILTISELVPGMSQVGVIGRIKRIHKIRHYTNKDGQPNQLRKIELVDMTGEIAATLWGNKVFEIEEKGIDIGKIVRLKGCEVRENKYDNSIELSLSSHTLIDVDPVGVSTDDYPPLSVAEPVQISSIVADMKDVSIVAKVMNKRKVSEFTKKDGTKGKVSGLFARDLTGGISITFWGDDVKVLEEITEGKAYRFSDLVSRMNKDRVELTYQSYSQVTQVEDPALEQVTGGGGQANNVTIDEVMEGMKRVNIVGKVLKVYEKKEFSNGQLQSLLLMDSTGTIRVTVWNDLVRKIQTLKEGDVLRLSNLYAKYNDYSQKVELNAGEYSDISINNEQDLANFSDVTPPKITLSDILDKETGVFIRLQVERINDIRSVTRADGTAGQVLNLNVIDENGERGRVTAWDDDIEMLSNLSEGDAVEVQLGRAKRDDYGVNVTIGRNSKVVPINDFSAELTTADKLLNSSSNLPETPINQLTPGTRAKIRAKVVSVHKNVRIYDSCPECKKKVVVEEDSTTVCPNHGPVTPVKRLIVGCTLDDQNGTIKTTFFDKSAESILSVTAAEAFDLIERLKDDEAVHAKYADNAMQREIIVVGNVRLNQEEEPEFSVSWFNDINMKSETNKILDALKRQ